MATVTLDKASNTLTITLKLPAEPSASKSSGKLNNCGGTGGFVLTPAVVAGKPVKINVCAIC